MGKFENYLQENLAWRFLGLFFYLVAFLGRGVYLCASLRHRHRHGLDIMIMMRHATYGDAQHVVIVICHFVREVTQLSLTNPRDALHHGKRQNFKTVT